MKKTEIKISTKPKCHPSLPGIHAPFAVIFTDTQALCIQPCQNRTHTQALMCGELWDSCYQFAVFAILYDCVQHNQSMHHGKQHCDWTSSSFAFTLADNGEFVRRAAEVCSIWRGSPQLYWGVAALKQWRSTAHLHTALPWSGAVSW